MTEPFTVRTVAGVITAALGLVLMFVGGIAVGSKPNNGLDGLRFQAAAVGTLVVGVALFVAGVEIAFG